MSATSSPCAPNVRDPGAIVVRPYLDDPSQAYAAADLVLARAGASTLAELAATGKPAILVPYPFAADDHQASNAERFAADGAAEVVADAGLQRGVLRGVLARSDGSGANRGHAGGGRAPARRRSPLRPFSPGSIG